MMCTNYLVNEQFAHMIELGLMVILWEMIYSINTFSEIQYGRRYSKRH